MALSECGRDGGASGGGSDENDLSLPPLREELQIISGSPLLSGAPTWLIFDPVRHRYFKIGRRAFELFSHWSLATASQLTSVVSGLYERTVSREEIEALIGFVFANGLTTDPPKDGFRGLHQSALKQDVAWWKRVVHHYLFFRIPLFRPTTFLQATWPFVAPFMSKFAVITYLVCAMIGLYLVSRQWDVFTTTFLAFLSTEGFLAYGLSLIFVKAVHELGHAYMATRYGLKVPTIGIAFMVMMPILYTDATDAWRLRRRRDRLMIDGAGIFSELALASLATLLWVFLPDGPMRSVAFSVATVSWVLSLFVNLNPFMRFDGYYILSDSLGVENLQERGFQMARWRMREIFFGLGLKPPERLSRGLQTTLILHAWGTWIYRFFLFIGIALLVYYFFTKTAGLFLFAVEILWFILLPIGREIKVWWSMKSQIIRSRRTLFTTAIAFALLAVFFVPWSGRVSVSAIALAQEEVSIFPPQAAKIVSVAVTDGQHVEKGQLLAKLSSEQLLLDMNLAEQKIALLKLQLARAHSNSEDRSLLKVTKREFEAETRKLTGLLQQREKLTVLAPFSGTVVDVERALHPARHVSARQLLMRIRGQGDIVLRGYLPEEGLRRVGNGTNGKFVPDNPRLSSASVEVSEIGAVNVAELDQFYYAQLYGGVVPTLPSDQQGGLRPMGAYYPLVLRFSEVHNDARVPQSRGHVQRGRVMLKGKAESYARRVFRQVFSVLIRESGF